jgi:hypothetical protein
MHSFSYRGFNTGAPLDRKSVWILFTALAFAFITLVTAYGITLPPGVAPLGVVLDTLAPSDIRPQVW